MLRFLKTIRQKLLLNGKIKKYAFYAIGEILLVTFGILLAFQINQWNEAKKARQLELDLLSDIEEGLTQDIVELGKALEFQVAINASQNALIRWLDSEAPYHDSLSGLWPMSALYSDFQAHLGPFETLKQFGLKNVQNDSLRILITQLYEVAYPNYVQFLEVYKAAQSDVSPHLEKHLLELDWTPGSLIQIHDVKELRTDKALRFRVGSLQNIGESLPVWRTPQLINQAQITLEMLQEEIRNQ